VGLVGSGSEDFRVRKYEIKREGKNLGDLVVG
jgi:hypothetical protein